MDTACIGRYLTVHPLTELDRPLSGVTIDWVCFHPKKREKKRENLELTLLSRSIHPRNPLPVGDFFACAIRRSWVISSPCGEKKRLPAWGEEMR
ncbi:hypothetical protein BHM03_00044542 [Ensete ventricosum]|nr:hypothetical protein BHM03_00044542 [Ensete ventricosum]